MNKANGFPGRKLSWLNLEVFGRKALRRPSATKGAPGVDAWTEAHRRVVSST